MAQIINLNKFKSGGYKSRKHITCEECIYELDAMLPNATERQQAALGLAINLIIDFMKGVDDGK